MADNVAITAGTGTTIAADDIGGVLHQRVKISQGADGVGVDVSSAAPLQVTGANGSFPVTDNASSLTVDAPVATPVYVRLSDGASAIATLPVSLATNTPTLQSGSTTAVTQATGTNLHTVVDSGTVTTVSTVTNLSQLGGAAIAMGTGVRTAGTQRVTVATDDVVPVTGTFWQATQPVSLATNTPTLQSGSTTAVTQATANKLHIVLFSATGTTVSTVTNLSQMGGAAISMGTGARGAGVQRVTIATDDVVPASQSGTWTVQPGNTANSTPWLVSQTATTTGGLTTYHLASAATTNATVIKASAGQVYGWFIYNSNAAARKLVFHNSASTPTAGASVFFSLVIPPSSGANVFTSSGIAFSTGIAITTVTDLADSGTTTVAANDLIINIFYK